MSADHRCEKAQFELSVSHDERRPPPSAVTDHVASCETCTAFRRRLGSLDELLAAGSVDQAPDIGPKVMGVVRRPRTRWLSVAAVIAVGAVIGALAGGVNRPAAVQARDLGDRLQAASPGLADLSAELLVVERGWHSAVPERIYVGSLHYVAPERMTIELSDTTSYPNATWMPNNVSVQIADGDMLTVASSRCPVAALPGCQGAPATIAVADQRPFTEGVLVPLEIVSPARSLRWWSGLDVLGSPVLDGRETIQVQTTVAAATVIQAVTDRGAWREFHSTDQVLMWLDKESLVPVRIEVYATQSPERELWQLRRGYADESNDPIFIIELTPLAESTGSIVVDLPDGALSGGYVDGPVTGLEPVLGPGFRPHRSGHWVLPDGGEVDVETFSDGGSWLMIESTDSWTGSQLFGASIPLVRRIELEPGSIGYLNLNGDALAIHGTGLDVLVSGSVAQNVLVAAAASLGVRGIPVPNNWAEAAVVDVPQLPAEALVPDVEGWSMLGTTDGDRITVLMTGGGSRTVLINSIPGVRLAPPIGADFLVVDVRATTGRFDAASATLEWVEAGRIVQMRSETVGMEELIGLANAMATP